MKIFNIEEKFKADFFKKLLLESINYCKFFSFIEEDKKNANIISFFEKIRPFLVKSNLTASWPGTKLYSEEKRINYYNLNVDSLKILMDIDYTDYINLNKYPEDLCFYRKDYEVWMGSIAHEKDYFLELAEKEFLEIKNKYPYVELINEK